MTCITNIKTKKGLKNAVDRGETVLIEDPSIFNPFTGTLKEYVESREECFITNHPKRSWFARVTKKGNKLKVE